MNDKTRLQELCEAEDMAYFRGDLVLSMPDSYTLDERREILSDMIETAQASLDEMWREFHELTVSK